MKLSLLVGPPNSLPYFDITRIQWDEKECMVRVGSVRKPVTLVPARAGGSFRIKLPYGFLESMDGEQPIELALQDIKGNRWAVRPFFPAENMVPLYMLESEDKIISDYGDS